MSGVTVLAESRPVARKRHMCGNCQRPIEAGEHYLNQRNTYDGHAYTWKSHDECHILFCRLSWEWRMEDDDAIDPDEFRRLLAEDRANRADS